MSLYDNGNGLSAADVAAVMGNNGYGNGNMGWGDGSFWIIVLFLFALMGNGFGGFGGGNAMPYVVNNTANDVQRGFDQQAVMSGINDINNSICNGFNTSQMGVMQGMNTLAMSLQNCCCENRAGIADLKYTVATEACADRQAVTDALRDVQALITSSTQSIHDKLCQQEIDALKAQNANLQTQLNISALRESQTDQTAKVLANNADQTATILQRLNPTPIPAYVVQNPGCPSVSYNGGCGCNL